MDAEEEDDGTGSGGGETGEAGDAKGEAVTHLIFSGWHLGLGCLHQTRLADNLFWNWDYVHVPLLLQLSQVGPAAQAQQAQAAQEAQEARQAR